LATTGVALRLQARGRFFVFTRMAWRQREEVFGSAYRRAVDSGGGGEFLCFLWQKNLGDLGRGLGLRAVGADVAAGQGQPTYLQECSRPAPSRRVPAAQTSR